MTVSAQAISPAHATAWNSQRSSAWHDALAWAGVVATLLVLYLLVHNPYWVPGGDSEVYIAIARNLATGRGYMFNGQPVSMVPPGWPLVLAAAMKISPSFSLLKLLTMSCMLGSLAMAYWVCRRFVSPVLSALVILLCGILSHVYQLTFWLHSDALFCLTSTASLLLAMQISEGRAGRWRIAVLIVLCGVNVLVRWAGILSWLLVAAALLDGQTRPKLDRKWLTALGSGLIAAATFLGIRAAQSVSQEVAMKIRAFGGTAEESGAAAIVDKADKNVAMAYQWINPAAGGISGYLARAGAWGNWFSFLLWQPLRLARSSPTLGLISAVLGWCVLSPLLIYAWRSAWQKRWLWPALILYSFALAMNWPAANARYLVPIAFLIILGVFKGVRLLSREKWLGTLHVILALVFLLNWPQPQQMRRHLTELGLAMLAVGALYLISEAIRRRSSQTEITMACNVLLGYFAASIMLCNGALYACDVVIAQAEDFYQTYEAGLNKDLVYAAHWLNQRLPQDGQIAVCERYVNLGRARISRLGLRATTMLTGKAIVSVPMKYLTRGDPRKNVNFLNWARSLGVKYVLYQPEVSPWRVFHFRMGWLQEMMTESPAIDTGAGWRLYEIPEVGDEAVRISLAAVKDWPIFVPGM